jgi:hypothetical protein
MLASVAQQKIGPELFQAATELVPRTQRGSKTGLVLRLFAGIKRRKVFSKTRVTTLSVLAILVSFQLPCEVSSVSTPISIPFQSGEVAESTGPA